MVAREKISEFLSAIILVSISFLSAGCSTAESERSRGIQLADEGKWDEAIELLEKYISENPQPAVIEEIDKIPDFYEIENPEKLQEYLEVVLYLSASYLGKAGFDIRNVIDYIGEVAKLAKEGERGNEDTEEQTSRIIRDKIFSGLEDEAILERIYYMYKAQRLLEKTLYGEEGRIDSAFRQGNRQGKRNRIPNLGEAQVDIEKQRELFEVKRLINTIEYIAGKVLIWKTVSISAYLGHFDFYLEEEEKKGDKPLPSLCCKFQGEYPYLITIQNIYHLGYDVFQGIDYLSFGRFSEIDFSTFATRYSDVLGGIKRELDKRTERVCRAISKAFADALTVGIYDVIFKALDSFTEGLTVKVSKVEAKVSEREEYEENGVKKIKVEDTGIWLCPRNISDFMEKISFEYLCGEANKVRIDIKLSKPFGTKKEGERYFDIFFRKPEGNTYTYVNCDGERVNVNALRRTLSVVISIDENVLDTVADKIVQSICERDEVKKMRDEIESFAENPFEREGTELFSEMIDKIEEIVRKLFEQREDPRECVISQ